MIDLTAGGFIERFNFLEGDFIKKKSLMECYVHCMLLSDTNFRSAIFLVFFVLKLYLLIMLK